MANPEANRLAYQEQNILIGCQKPRQKRLTGMEALNNRARGRKAELYACAYLLRQGIAIVARNYQYRGGELDIVARTPQGLWLFVEVKSVSHPGMGNPNRRIGFSKQDRIWRTAAHYLHHHGGLDQASRFDVLTLDQRHNHPRILHYPGAFEGKSSLPYC
jgi:putative endonuclease